MRLAAYPLRLRHLPLAALRPAALWLVASSFVVSGCLFGLAVDDEVDEETTGELRVSVSNGFGTPSPSVEVVTVPATRAAVTDGSGLVFFGDLEPGAYQVLARSGSAEVSTFAVVRAGQTETVPLVLPVVDRNFVTIDFIDAPVRRPYEPGEELRFRLRVTSTAFGVDRLRVSVALGDIAADSSLAQLTPGAGGVVDFSTALRYGVHALYFTVTDPAGRRDVQVFSADVTSLGRLTLAPLAIDAEGNVTLRWNAVRTMPSPPVYAVFRGTDACVRGEPYHWEQLGSELGATDTVFVDPGPAPLGERVCYQIVANSYGSGYRLQSDVVSYAVPATGRRPYRVTAVLAHPTDPDVVYLVNARDARLERYDLAGDRVTGAAQLSGSLGRPALGDAGAGVEVFVPSSNGTVFVLDPETLARKAVVSTTSPALEVAAFESGFLAVSLYPTADRDFAYATYARATGARVDVVPYDSDFPPGTIRRVPGQAAAVGSANGRVYYFGFDTSGRFATEKRRLHSAEGSTRDVAEVSPDGGYFVAFESGALFRADDALGALGVLDIPPDRLASVAFSADGKKVYSGVFESYAPPSRRQVRDIVVNAYPSRLSERTLPTRGGVYGMARLADGRLATLQIGLAGTNFTGNELDRESYVIVVDPR